jgi:hypothetical protein
MAHMLTAAGALRLPPLQQPPRRRPFMRLVCHAQPTCRPCDPTEATTLAFSRPEAPAPDCRDEQDPERWDGLA